MTQEKMTGEEARRARMLCHVAAAVFAACGVLLFFIPAPAPVRAVAGCFNLVIAAAVVLYARTLRAP